MRKLRLAWFDEFSSGGWDDPGYSKDNDWRDLDFYLDIARELERGKFDLIIGADSYAIFDYRGSRDIWVRSGDRVAYMHPIPVMTAMSTVTKRLGFVPTLSTFAYPPYLLAREVATLDHLTRGRIGWNIVTSTGGRTAQNFGDEDMLGRDERYDQADEFVDVCKKLWSSWEPDAVLLDHERGIFADPTKVHDIDFAGQWYKVRGPLTMGAGPQGRPLYLQAGASPRGMDFAAKHADAVIANPSSIESMKAYRDGIKDRARSIGRDPESIKVIFGMKPILGATQQAADARKQELQDEMARKYLEIGLANLSIKTGLDLSQFPLDDPLDEQTVVATGHSAGAFYQHYADGARPSIRELAAREALKESYPLVGTPEGIADTLEELVEEVGFDGLAIRESISPARVSEIVDNLVPVLRARGLVREDFRHETLLDNFFDTDAWSVRPIPTPRRLRTRSLLRSVASVR